MSSSSSAKILIVDDEAAQMKALCDTLQDSGYVTHGFTSAKGALKTLKQKQYDLLLTDLMMPEMDGITFLRSALEIDPHLVSIMMTGHGTIGTAVEAMQAGALDYILKPFKLTAVLPVLSRALAVRKLRLENLALQKRILERTTELEAANRELDAFAHSVSHDLRAPLRAVDGFSKIVLQRYASQMPPDAERLLGQITKGAERMAILIDDLLRFSRFNRQPIKPQLVDMMALFREVIEELRRESENQNTEIQVVAVPETVGDFTLLKQVVLNLVSNAFKFTRKKMHPIIEIGAREEDGMNIYFVRDNGAGFDMQYAEKLFGVFQRLHRSDEFEGTGVGLSIVQRIVIRHGGRIWAEAEVDKGATFYFSLPPYKAQAED